MGNNILIVDLESTCEKGQVPGDGYHNQIIEIGAVWVSPNGQVLDQFEQLVKANLPISGYCTELTTITQSESDGGATFAEACEALAEFAGRYPSNTWGSWGGSDLRALAFDCAYHGIKSPIDGWVHRNLKAEFAKQRKIKQVGMARALKIMGIVLEGAHHRALPDVMNIAKLLAATQK